jgi:hypothetical protein
MNKTPCARTRSRIVQIRLCWAAGGYALCLWCLSPTALPTSTVQIMALALRQEYGGHAPHHWSAIILARSPLLSWLFRFSGSGGRLRSSPQRFAPGLCRTPTLGSDGLTHGHHSQLWVLAGIRFHLGAAESLIVPAMLVLLTKWFTRAERSRANTVLILGNPVTVLWMSALTDISSSGLVGR